MRGLPWILMMLALAMFMVGCDSGPATPPAGADSSTVLEVDEDYVPPEAEQGGQQATEVETEG